MAEKGVHIFQFDKQIVTLKYEGFEDEIDVDEICKIDYSNIYGEVVTCTALMNRVGIIRAEAESILKEKELLAKIEEARIKKDERRKAVSDSRKITEGGLEEMVMLMKVSRL